MNNPRMLLWGLLALVLFWNLQTWQRDYPSAPPTPVAPLASAAPVASGSSAPLFDALPDAPKPASSVVAAAPTATPGQRHLKSQRHHLRP